MSIFRMLKSRFLMSYFAAWLRQIRRVGRFMSAKSPRLIRISAVPDGGGIRAERPARSCSRVDHLRIAVEFAETSPRNCVISYAAAGSRGHRPVVTRSRGFSGDALFNRCGAIRLTQFDPSGLRYVQLGQLRRSSQVR